jgi:hypothetical protein
MKTNVRQLKIKLEVPQDVIKYFQLKEQWENERGSISSNCRAELGNEIQAPLTPGFSYTVIDGRFMIEENDLFYIVNIKPDLSLFSDNE